MCERIYDPHLPIWWYCPERIITVWMASIRCVPAMQQHSLNLVLFYAMSTLLDVLPCNKIFTIHYKSPDTLFECWLFELYVRFHLIFTNLSYAGVGIRTQVFQGNNRSRACRVSPLCHPGNMQRLGTGCYITVTAIFNVYGSDGWDVGIRVQKSRKPGIRFHSHSTTSTLIRLVVPATLLGIYSYLSIALG